MVLWRRARARPFAPNKYIYCHAILVDGTECGQRIDWDGTCPHHYLHDRPAPLVPRLWPSRAWLIVGFLVWLVYWQGWYLDFGPVDPGAKPYDRYFATAAAQLGPTGFSTHPNGNSVMIVNRGEQYGIYYPGPCYNPALRHAPTILLRAEVTSGVTSLTLRMIPLAKERTFSFRDMGPNTHECAVFTSPRTGTYVITSQYFDRVTHSYFYEYYPTWGFFFYNLADLFRDGGLIAFGVGLLLWCRYYVLLNRRSFSATIDPQVPERQRDIATTD